MKPRLQYPPWLLALTGVAEWTVAGVLTLAAAAVHNINMRAGGGLWRDEAAGVHLACMPSWSEIWNHLEHESFPLLFTGLLRASNSIGAGSDDALLRALGLLVGLLVLAALWWSSWSFSSGPPLLSLLLFGFSPTVTRWGDSVRAYGLGVVLILLALAAIWRVLQSRSSRTVALAMVCSVAAVQTLYQNAFILAAICLAGVMVATRRRDLKGAIVVVSIGLAAALSLLPYWDVIARANEWNLTTQVPIDLARIWVVLHRAVSDRGPLMPWLWAGLVLAAVVSGGRSIAKPTPSSPNDSNRDAICFLLASAFGTIASYYAFLKVLKFPTEVWYYLVGLAMVAVVIDAILGRTLRRGWMRVLRLTLVALALVWLFPEVANSVRVRMTNLDLVAQRLNEVVVEQDLIVVHPWFCAASLSRYYDGKAELTTLPPLADVRLQRLDLFKEQMKLEDPIQPVLEKMETTLRSGHTVWLVGYFFFPNPPRPPPELPRAGEGPEGWRAAPYMEAYGMEAAYFLQYHGGTVARVEVDPGLPVNPFENLPLRSIKEWR